MILEETQDKEDILILMLIQERDNYIKLKEEENERLKGLLVQHVEENRRLIKIIRELKSKRNK